MKRRNLKLLNWWFICIAASISSIAQGQVEVKVNFFEHHIGFLEPIWYTVNVTNNHEGSVEVFEPSNSYGTLVFEYFSMDSMNWKQIISTRGFLGGLKERPVIRIEPKDTFTYSSYFFALADTKVQPKYLFRGDNKYRIRGRYFVQYDEKYKALKILTNEVELNIDAYNGRDRKAVEYLLREKKIPHALFEAGNAALEIEEVLHFVRRFPDTSLAHWGRLFILNWKISYLRKEFDALWLGERKSTQYKNALRRFLGDRKEILRQKLEEIIQLPQVKDNLKFEANRLLKIYAK